MTAARESHAADVVRGAVTVTPFFFDAGGLALFGVYHAPRSRARKTAVVVCPPCGPDYVRSHRGLRQLAVRLADRGFPVLRFDLSGCGDSAGDSMDCDVRRWREDIAAAIRVAQARSGVRAVCLIGLKVGASLAAFAASSRDDVCGLVLWEPTVSGTRYVADLLERQRARDRAYPILAAAEEMAEPQALGMPLPETLRRGLEEIDLLQLDELPKLPVLIVEAHEDEARADLRERLESGGAAVDVVVASAPAAAGDLLYRIVVPHATIESIVAWAVHELP